MKRKRGSKKGHKKSKIHSPLDPISSPICLDQSDDDDNNNTTDLDPPPPFTGHSRLKVKLKPSSRLIEQQPCSSDTDKSNKLELNEVIPGKEEDGSYSESEMQNVGLFKKAGSIKIKSSRSVGGFASDVNSCVQMLGERNLRQGDVKQGFRDARYNEKELAAALAVIKKIMKMEAAAPFNAPVDPVALGIPDYFDIIDTPMDFGTICHELEHGHKYMNSEDVYKDVQFIWGNCYKYNNKGDYIIDLMKRVKKNFMKYWMTAELFTGASDSIQIEDDIKPTQGKVYPKGKAKHKRRRHGIDLHKSDCLCAVCVVRRRRKEREQNSVASNNQTRLRDANLSQQFKTEETSPLGNPCSDDGTSSLDHSQEIDADAGVGEFENEEKIETPEADKQAMLEEMELRPNASGSSEPSLQLPLDNETQEDSNQNSQEQELDLGFVTEPGVHRDEVEVQQYQDEDRRQGQSMAQENRVQQENHSVLYICRSLFPSDVRSVWNGPHSLSRRHVSSSIRDSPIHTAVAAFLRQ